jgi:hypothetical protein
MSHSCCSKYRRNTSWKSQPLPSKFFPFCHTSATDSTIKKARKRISTTILPSRGTLFSGNFILCARYPAGVSVQLFTIITPFAYQYLFTCGVCLDAFWGAVIGRWRNIKLSKECEERPLRNSRYCLPHFSGWTEQSLQLAVTIADLRVETEPYLLHGVQSFLRR